MNYRTKCRVRQCIAISILFLIAILLLLMPIFGTAFAETTEGGAMLPTEPLTWDYLATVGGAAVFVLIAVQLTKGLLDKVWKIPTTLYAYILAVITMILATAFTTGLSPSAILLTLFNGWIVSATASKTYDAMAKKKEPE